MSIIRYRFKADKNFESVKIDGMSCSLGELKRLIAAKSSRSGSYHPKDDYDLIISNANTHEEYKDNSDPIPRNASVIVARRIRGATDTLTPITNQKPVVSSDDIVKDILLPAILHQNQSSTTTTTTTTSSVIETNAIPLEKLTESTSNGPGKEPTEDELIKKIQMGSHARYVTPQPAYRTNIFVCHHCKQHGHIRSQCPSLPQSSNSNSTGNASNSSTTTDDAGQTSTSGPIRPSMAHSSHIITRHAPYSMPYHHRGNHSRRGQGHSRGEPIPKKTTGIPRDRLIPVPKHIPGALRDQTGASVVPRQMAELFVERIEKKADALAQIARQADEKNVSSSIPPSSKSTDDDLPPPDLLCPLCHQVYSDAVITPCCNLSFCDDCIRTALIESSEHECPSCHCQHVAIDQINPNLYLRNHIKRWHERLNQSSYSHISVPQQTLEQELSTTSTNTSNANEPDEYDTAILPTSSQQSVTSGKTAPIVIKMQPRGKTPSPPPAVSTRPADMTFEDEKTSDSTPLTSSQKDVKTNEEIIDILPSSTTTIENEKLEREIPLSHMPLTNTTYTSPSLATSIAPTNAVIPHYYPPPQHHNIIYPHHIPPTTSNGLYPIQTNYYPPPMGVRYPPGGMHPYQPYAPVPPIHHHHPIPPPPPPRPIVPSPHIPTNGYNMPGFHPHANVPFTSTSTFITHHQTATQPISTALSEDEFYTKQRYFQRRQRSHSHRRSRSSSYSSYSSSDSRSSSRSRYERRRRSSRSRSRRRIKKSPSRDNRRQRRSSSYQNRRRAPPPPPPPPPPADTKDRYSSSRNRRSLPRPSRAHERRRSPRPPPTVQQSTQRTIVYMQESSHSSRDRRRTKSRSRGIDDRITSSKKEQPSQSESVSSPSTTMPTTLSSKIETVVEDSLGKVQDDNGKNGKKHKKHHKKHRHSSSKSKKHHRSKDKDKKTMVDATSSVIEVQS